MPENILAVKVRRESGKEAARKLRNNSQIPAIFYGPEIDPIKLTVDYSDLERTLKMTGGENAILELQIHSDEGTRSWKAMLKELQIDPIKNNYLHADFYEISMDREITVDIPIQLVNTPVGVSADNGVLQHIRREVTIACLPSKLVDAVEVDVSGLQIGDSLHISDINLPEGIRAVEDEHLTLAVVAAPTEEPAEAVEEEEEAMLEEEATEEGETESPEES
jgi:large subunit ribosomal protein L25